MHFAARAIPKSYKNAILHKWICKNHLNLHIQMCRFRNKTDCVQHGLALSVDLRTHPKVILRLTSGGYSKLVVQTKAINRLQTCPKVLSFAMVWNTRLENHYRFGCLGVCIEVPFSLATDPQFTLPSFGTNGVPSGISPASNFVTRR